MTGAGDGSEILAAASIITMDPAAPRADAIAFDVPSGVITAVGSLEECTAASPAPR